MTPEPIIHLSGNRNAYGRGQDNPIGLKLIFSWDGKTARAVFTPGVYHQGWPGIVHGGIILALIDEAAGSVVSFSGLDCVSARVNVKLKRPARINEPLTVSATLREVKRRLVITDTLVSDKNGVEIAGGEVTLMIIKPEYLQSTVKAVIFDMDGVIADTAEYHYRAWHDALAKFGINLIRFDFPNIFGRRDDTIVKMYLGDKMSPEEAAKIIAKKEGNLLSIMKGNIKALPGAVKLIKSLKQSGYKLALASSSTPEVVNLVLDSVGVKADFDAIVSGKEVAESKPSPQIYLKAAEEIGVMPENAVVIEDAVIGIEGAKRGGMKAIAVTTSHKREEFAVVHPDIIVDSLEELNVADFEKFLDNRA
jgi:beta-phosphoglucomutase